MSLLARIFGSGSPEEPPRPTAPVPAAVPPRPEPVDPPSPVDIAGEAAQERIRAGGIILLDVREKHELESTGWICGMIHIPMNQVPDRLAELESSRPVIVYCASGMRSYNVGCFLLENGFREVYNLDGGISCWTGVIERA